MYIRFIFITLFFCMSNSVSATDIEQLKIHAAKINKAGSIAAEFSEVSKTDVAPSVITDTFGPFGPEILSAARVWAVDSELKDAPPAFRRYLFFEYLTMGTEVIAGASNPDDRLINIDADVFNLFEDERIARAAANNMKKSIPDPVYIDLDDYLLASFPMKPAAEDAKKCMTCHASTEVNRPYPKGERILGYTFIALPK